MEQTALENHYTEMAYQLCKCNYCNYHPSATVNWAISAVTAG